jgi:hypothetical protein
MSKGELMGNDFYDDGSAHKINFGDSFAGKSSGHLPFQLP